MHYWNPSRKQLLTNVKWIKSKRSCVTSGSIFCTVSSQVVIPFDKSGKSGFTKYVMLLMTSSEQVAVTVTKIFQGLKGRFLKGLTDATDAETKGARSMRRAPLNAAFVGVHADA